MNNIEFFWKDTKEGLLVKSIAKGNTNAFFRQRDINWKQLSIDIIEYLSIVDENDVNTKINFLPIINSCKLIVNEDTLYSKKLDGYYWTPVMLIMKMDFNMIALLLSRKLGPYNYLLFEYNVYRLLYSYFPNNQSYWEKYLHHMIKIEDGVTTTDFIESEDKREIHKEVMMYEFILGKDDFKVNDKLCINRLGQIILYYITKVSMVEIKQYTDLLDFCLNEIPAVNKIISSDLRLYTQDDMKTFVNENM